MTDSEKRIIDVNLNRLTEGLRVVEDTIRFSLENKKLLMSIRKIRTNVQKRIKDWRFLVITARSSETDLGRGDRFDRLKRKNLNDVLVANLRRAQEASRVLEEVTKIPLKRNRKSPNNSLFFKKLRFSLYDLEKKVFQTRFKE